MSDSETHDRYGASFLTQKETIMGTWEYGPREFELKVEDISAETQELLQRYIELAGMAMGSDGEVDEELKEEMNDKADGLESLPWEDDSEFDSFVECTLDQKLVKPDVDVSEARNQKVNAVFAGMMDAWQEGNR